VAVPLPKWDTGHGRAGAGGRKLEVARRSAAFSLLIALFAGMYLSGGNVRRVATFGFPVACLVAVGFLYWAKATGGKAGAHGQRDSGTRRRELAGEDAGARPAALTRGYFLVHDYVTDRGTIDCIVVSPKGIATIETMGHEGVVTCDDGKLRCDGQLFEKDFVKHAWAQAFCIRDLLAGQRVSAPEPQPVIWFPTADVRVREKVKGVEIVGGGHIPDCLARLPNRMSAREAEKIFESLRLSQAQMFV